MSTQDELWAHLREQVEVAVLGGYRSDEEVLTSIEELATYELKDMKDSAGVEQLLAYARRRLEEHRVEQAGWTEPSVNDAIDRAFEELNHQGILALQDAGYTLSEGWSEAKALAARSSELLRGATFFHGQDVERGVLGGGLMLAFGAFEDDPKRRDEADLAIAREVRETLARHGIETEWNGSVKTRIQIPPFEWRKRTRDTDLDPDSLQQRVLRTIIQEQGISEEAAIEALEAVICEAALKHYGEDRRLDGKYDPECGCVALFEALLAVERLDDDPAVARSQRTVAELALRGFEVEPGDELVFQLFYRPEDAREADAQDEQYGAVLDWKTAGRPLRWRARDLRDGILETLRDGR
jgi:hypothetical protein